MKYLSIILLFGLYACYSPGKAIQKAYDKAPGKVAEFTRDKFPCAELSADTTVIYRDSVIMVECPDFAPDTVTVLIPDTKVVTNTRTVRVPVNLPVRTVTITKIVEDSAKIFLANNERDKAVKDYEDEHDRRKTLLKWFRWLLLAFIVSLVLHYLRFKKWL